MTEQWRELKVTITEMRDNDGTGTQQEVCKFLANLMETLEKQMQEPCEDCISRQAVIDKAFDFMDDDCETYRAVYVSDIRTLPPVTPKRPKGEWIEVFVETPNDPYSYGFKAHKCSKCEHIPLRISNYCPNCGAEMNRGEEE